MRNVQLRPAGIYMLRPDIFLRNAVDRIHVQYAGEHYIVRLQPECIRYLYKICDLLNGSHSLGDAMEYIPAAHRGYILKFLEFLICKGAAFQIAAPLAESYLAPVQDSLLYLRSFVDDSAAAFGHVLAAHILLAGGGYALIGAIKTLARLGVRSLSVLQTGTAWQPHELQATFADLARWTDATLSIVDTPTPAHTCVLQCADDAAFPFERLIAALPQARHLVAFVAGGQLCVLRGDDLALLVPRHAGPPPGPPDGLCAGATAAMVCFDDVCGVRPLAARRYLHFGLDADVPLNSAGLYPLLPFAAGRAGADDAIAIAARIEELVHTPLSPLRAPVERTVEGSHIKLYTVEAWLESDGAPVTLAGAGMTRLQCMAGALRQLIDSTGHWFCHTAPAERAAIGVYLEQLDSARRAVMPLRAAPPAPGVAPALSAREQYLSFCINAAHGVRVRWADAPLAAAVWPRCAVLSAGDMTIYLPHDGTPTGSQREAGLLALYAALWQGVCTADVVLAQPPLAPVEAS